MVEDWPAASSPSPQMYFRYLGYRVVMYWSALLILHRRGTKNVASCSFCGSPLRQGWQGGYATPQRPTTFILDPCPTPQYRREAEERSTFGMYERRFAAKATHGQESLNDERGAHPRGVAPCPCPRCQRNGRRRALGDTVMRNDRYNRRSSGSPRRVDRLAAAEVGRDAASAQSHGTDARSHEAGSLNGR
eukprot:1187622-Prorocentrum_minimum.AAC.3